MGKKASSEALPNLIVAQNNNVCQLFVFFTCSAMTPWYNLVGF